MNNFKNWLIRFMSGRYGPDQFSRFLLFPGYALWIIGLLVNILLGRTMIGNLLGTILNWAGLFCIIFSTYRMFSKKHDKRSAENQKFLVWYSKYQPKVNTYINRFKQRKQYKFVRCPKCKTVGRIPRGRGKVTITCTSCRHEFKCKS